VARVATLEACIRAANQATDGEQTRLLEIRNQAAARERELITSAQTHQREHEHLKAPLEQELHDREAEYQAYAREDKKFKEASIGGKLFVGRGKFVTGPLYRTGAHAVSLLFPIRQFIPPEVPLPSIYTLTEAEADGLRVGRIKYRITELRRLLGLPAPTWNKPLRVETAFDYRSFFDVDGDS
jgi:hypothetical protein